MLTYILTTYLPVFSLILSFLFFYYFRNALKKKSLYFYLLSFALVAILVLFDYTYIKHNFFKDPWLRFVYDLFKRGTIGTSIFIIVMMIGAFKPTTWFYRTFMPIRGEMSIIGGIFVLCHNIIYGKYYFVLLFTNPALLKHYQIIASCLSIIGIMILVPLWLTSFLTIRKKISPTTWKNLQKLAYIYYFVVLFHILVLYFTNLNKALLSPTSHRVDLYIVGLSFYIGLYALYLLLKTYKVISSINRPSIN